MEIREKACPWCGSRSPLGTCCSPACEAAHNQFQARAVWKKHIWIATIAVCVLSLLKNTVPEPLRMVLVIVWAVFLCVSHIVLPYSVHVVGCEKNTERRVRTAGVIALLLLGGILVFLYTLNADLIYGVIKTVAATGDVIRK